MPPATSTIGFPGDIGRDSDGDVERAVADGARTLRPNMFGVRVSEQSGAECLHVMHFEADSANAATIHSHHEASRSVGQRQVKSGGQCALLGGLTGRTKWPREAIDRLSCLS